MEPEKSAWCLFPRKGSIQGDVSRDVGSFFDLAADLRRWGGVSYFWYWTNWIARLDVFVRALMLTYVIVVFSRAFCRSHFARRAQDGVHKIRTPKVGSVGN